MESEQSIKRLSGEESCMSLSSSFFFLNGLHRTKEAAGGVRPLEGQEIKFA
jgi:hypothetical protein